MARTRTMYMQARIDGSYIGRRERERKDHRRHSSSQLSGSTSFHRLVKVPSRQGVLQFGISMGCGVTVSVLFRYINCKKRKECRRKEWKFLLRVQNNTFTSASSKLGVSCNWKTSVAPYSGLKYSLVKPMVLSKLTSVMSCAEYR